MFNKSKIISSESLVAMHQGKGVAIISLITYIFLNNVLPEQFLSRYISENVPEQFQLIGSSTIISTLALLVFYYSDPLFKGNNDVSRWIRTLYASNLLIDKYEIDVHSANSLWFKYFNQWQHKEHPNHSFLKKSHSASYSARLVYFISILCLVYGICALLIYLYSYFNERALSYLFLSIPYLFFGVVLYVLNAPPNYEGGKVTKPVKGVWHSVESSFQEAKSRFDAEVVSPCKTLNEAEKLVEASSQKWMK